NIWSWELGTRKPRLVRGEASGDLPVVRIEHPDLSPEFRLYVEGAPRLLFTDNDTNARRLFGDGRPDAGRKDAFHDAVVHGREDLLLPDGAGTKVAAQHRLTIAAGGRAVLRLRLVDGMPADPFGGEFDRIVGARQREADEFYATVIPGHLGEDARNVMRQALA